MLDSDSLLVRLPALATELKTELLSDFALKLWEAACYSNANTLWEVLLRKKDSCTRNESHRWSLECGDQDANWPVTFEATCK